MKKLLSWGGAGLLSSALLDPLVSATLGQPVPWLMDFLMLVGGSICLYLLVRFREWI